MDDGKGTLQEADTLKGKFLTFWTDGQLFGVPIADVVQIIGIQAITPVPEFPEYAKGIINLRGSIIPIIDVRLRFHKQEAEYDERTCIIVTNINETCIGFVVDSVDEVTFIEDDQISPPPGISSETTDNYLIGIGRVAGKVVLLLDTSRIFSDNEMRSISSAAQMA